MTEVDPMKIDRYYFPIDVSQVENLLGQMLTQVEAMNLREQVEKANKDIVRQRIWKWFEDVQENSLTSYQGCIAPIFDFSENGTIVKSGPQTNRWGYICKNGCHKSRTQGSKAIDACSECPPYPEDFEYVRDNYDDSKPQSVAVELPQ